MSLQLTSPFKNFNRFRIITANYKSEANTAPGLLPIGSLTGAKFLVSFDVLSNANHPIMKEESSEEVRVSEEANDETTCHDYTTIDEKEDCGDTKSSVANDLVTTTTGEMSDAFGDKTKEGKFRIFSSPRTLANNEAETSKVESESQDPLDDNTEKLPVLEANIERAVGDDSVPRVELSDESKKEDVRVETKDKDRKNDDCEKESKMTEKSLDETTSSSSTSSSSSRGLKNDPLTLIFADFVDLQTKIVLMPMVEFEGTGAVVASYLGDDHDLYEGLVLVAINGVEIYLDAEFTDLLAALRESTTPILLTFAPAQEATTEPCSLEAIKTQQVHEEKKEGDGGSNNGADLSTPKAGNTGNDDQEFSNDDGVGSKASIDHHGELDGTTIMNVESPQRTSVAKSFLEKRQSTPSKEHTRVIHSALDDHGTNVNSNFHNDDNNRATTFSSGMMALSAWGMKMKAKSEKLLAASTTSSATPQLSQHQTQTVNEKSTEFSCDMYLQSNLGAYFPISKRSSTKKIQHLEAVTTSSLFCIRKSATDPCTIGRQQRFGITVKYSFQWYHSASPSTQKYDWITPSKLYSCSRHDIGSAGDSTCTSKRTLSLDGSESSYVSCSSSSLALRSSCSSSVSSSSTNTYSSYTNSTNAGGKIGTASSKWIILEGATGPTFQPNTTLVGKRLRCVVIIRPVRGAPNDDTDDENDTQREDNTNYQKANPSDASDENYNSQQHPHQPEHDPLHAPLGDGEERVVCDSVVPVRADMVLFNGAKQVILRNHGGVAKFGNLVGRGETTSPVTKSEVCGKLFKIEVGSVQKSIVEREERDESGISKPPNTRPKRRTVRVNSLQIYCKDTPSEEYQLKTDVPLLQVTAKASPTNAKHVDLLFSKTPPVATDGNHSTIAFLSDYCVTDPTGIPRIPLEVPNRMTRESLLLSLGIANYPGKISDLDNKKIMFYDARKASSEIYRKSTSHNEQHQFLDASISAKSPENTTTVECPNPVPTSPPLLPKAPSQQTLLQKLTLSPSPNTGNEPQEDLSPLSCHSHPTTVEPMDTVVPPMIPTVDDSFRVCELQREMDLLRAQLSRKDKIIGDLQRRVQSSERAQQQSRQALVDVHQQLQHSQEDCERIQISKRHVERSMQAQHEERQKLEIDHKRALQDLEAKFTKSIAKIADLEKLNRSLQNEKAVLGASVEARESKLVKLEELQTANQELSEKVDQQESLRMKLAEFEKKIEVLQDNYQAKESKEAQYRMELETAHKNIQIMQGRIKGEQDKASTCQSRLEAIKKTNQQLKGERNSLKQKNESLSKEVTRLCRGGKSLREIEKVLADHESLRQETEVLRIQKRKALEDAHKYRTSYEQAMAAQDLLSSGMDDRETRRILERSKELERLLSEMTDYVSAKEMQLDTMKQVNEALQEEIHGLAKANLRCDEI